MNIWYAGNGTNLSASGEIVSLLIKDSATRATLSPTLSLHFPWSDFLGAGARSSSPTLVLEEAICRRWWFLIAAAHSAGPNRFRAITDIREYIFFHSNHLLSQHLLSQHEETLPRLVFYDYSEQPENFGSRKFSPPFVFGSRKKVVLTCSNRTHQT